MKKVTIKYEGKNTRPALRLLNREGKIWEFELEKGEASFYAEEELIYKLFWLVIGPKDASYKISLSTSDNFKVYARRNPFKLKVPQGNAGYGRLKFLIAKKEKSNVAVP